MDLRNEYVIIKDFDEFRLKKKINIYNYGNIFNDFTYIDDVVR